MPDVTAESLRAALPDVSGTLTVKGLDGPVEVYRDGYGVPHVRARSAQDAFFGQGFATAQDRLWQMDYDRRRAYGRRAEFAGRAALEQDIQMRRFQLAPTVRTDYHAVNSDTRTMLAAYSDGVNAFIDTTRTLPVEYGVVDGEPERWEPWDCLAVFKVRHILMGVFEAKLWRAHLVNALGPEKVARLCRGYQTGHLLIIPPGVDYDGAALDGVEALSNGADAVRWMSDVDSGSNSWALSGSRTASGKPLLAGDPHRGLDTPNVYYQNHISCPEFDVVGLSFPGCPGFPHFGHNSNVAWCVTHAGADYQDLYVERFDPRDATRYEFMGEWRQAEVRHEVIGIRGAKPVEMDVTVTHHGPLILRDRDGARGLSFKYTATAGPNFGSECLLAMLTASNVAGLDEAMKQWVDPCNNFLMADVHGDVAYLNRGKVPLRPMANAWLPVPGWAGEHEWQGHIPFEELPRSKNPDAGYIVTANNRIVGKDYPHYIALDFAPEYRARRIVERLKPMVDATVEDMAAVHAERVSIPARVYAELLERVEPRDDYSAAAKVRLKGWDGTMDGRLVEPTIYSAFRYRVHRAIAEFLLEGVVDEVFSVNGRCMEGQLRYLWTWLVTKVQENDTSLLPPQSDWESLAAVALADGVADLRKRLGEDIDSWQWGRVHHTRPRHTLTDSFPDLASLLDPPDVPMGGDGDTPQAASYCLADPFVLTSTSVSRYVFDLGDWDNSRWISPLGASGHPGSPHYSDQTSIWAEVGLIPMLYSWERIAAIAESHQTLLPG